MPSELQGLDYEPFVQALLEKTREGKLRWEETADEDAFLVSIRGEQTVEIRSAPSILVNDNRYEVVVRDREGKVLFDFSALQRSTAASLYQQAKRIASRIDEKLDSSLQLVKSL